MKLKVRLFFFLCFSSVFLQAQNCNCTVSQVQNNTVVPCNKTVGTVVTVNSVSTLQNAINQANASGGNMTILIANGTYQIASTSQYPYITANNVVFRSLSGKRDSVIIRGGGMVSTSSAEDGFSIVGNNVTIADLTIKEVGNHGIQVSGHNLYVHNVRIQNTYQQMIKGATAAASIDSAIVQCSLMEYPAGIGPNYYIGGLDIHKGKGWIVRDNVFKNIISPAGSPAEHAVHFWDNCMNNTVERNLIINCDRGIGFGLGTSPNSGGLICNNMIYNNGWGQFDDVGIGLETSPNTRVYNNTVFIQYFNAIEYRFTGTTNADIKNNLTNQAIAARDGGTATLGTNVTNAQSNWFVNVNAGDLHIPSFNPAVIDQGTSLSAFVTGDIDKTSRPQGVAFDIGAHEPIAPQGISENAAQHGVSIFPNPSKDGVFIVTTPPGNSSLKVFDLLGEVIYSASLCNENHVTINLDSRTKGMYILRIISVGKMFYDKIIIQ